MNRNLILFIMFASILTSPFFAAADYASDLKDQMSALEARFAKGIEWAYFGDAGIIARKADDAGFTDLTTTMIRTYLLKKMESMVTDRLTVINQKFETDPYGAAKQLSELAEWKEYFKPREEYLRTSYGQVVTQELIRQRSEALRSLSQCSADSIQKGVLALRQTQLFLTRTSEETDSVRELMNRLDCCMYWNPVLEFSYDYAVKTDYEEGVVKERIQLKLESDRRRSAEAKWVGDWRYQIDGKEGSADTLSKAVLTVRRGSEYGDLVISNAKINSVGRVSVAIPTSGEHRTIQVKGNPVSPDAIFRAQTKVPLTGCRNTK